MAILFTYPKFKALALDGTFLAGGLVYFYAPGTSTPKTTYCDAAKVTPHTHPVQLDTNGEATIYLDGIYDMTLKNSLGVTQWTMNNVGVADTTTDTANLYVADTGEANAYVVTPSPAFTIIPTGQVLFFNSANANSGASTLNTNGLGAVAIKKNANQDLTAGNILASQLVAVIFDGAYWQLIVPSTSISSATEPIVMIASQWWFDTTAHVLRIRNESNTAWIAVWDLANEIPMAPAIADCNVAYNSVQVLSPVVFSKGTDTKRVTSTNFYYCVTGTPINKSFSASGESIGTQTIQVNCWGLYKIVINAAGTVSFDPAPHNTDSGYSDEATAIADLPSTSRSITSLAIAIATKTFTTDSGRSYVASERVRATSRANFANWMEGVVVSYADTTLVVAIDLIGGSGTLADWNIDYVDECVLGYMTIKTKSGTTFIGGTDSLKDGATGNVASETNFYYNTVENTYRGSLSPIPSPLIYRDLYHLTSAHRNYINTPTINLNNMGPKLVKDVDGATLGSMGGMIVDNHRMLIYYDGTDLILLNSLRQQGMEIFTSSGIWVRPQGVNKVFVRVWGGGLAGGNGAQQRLTYSPPTSGTPHYKGGKGGSGGYSEGYIDVSGNATVVVGGVGGASSFVGDTTIQATGAGSVGANAIPGDCDSGGLITWGEDGVDGTDGTGSGGSLNAHLYVPVSYGKGGLGGIGSGVGGAGGVGFVVVQWS
jgi:hypothetical protein